MPFHCGLMCEQQLLRSACCFVLRSSRGTRAPFSRPWPLPLQQGALTAPLPSRCRQLPPPPAVRAGVRLRCSGTRAGSGARLSLPWVPLAPAARRRQPDAEAGALRRGSLPRAASPHGDPEGEQGAQGPARPHARPSARLPRRAEPRPRGAAGRRLRTAGPAPPARLPGAPREPRRSRSEPSEPHRAERGRAAGSRQQEHSPPWNSPCLGGGPWLPPCFTCCPHDSGGSSSPEGSVPRLARPAPAASLPSRPCSPSSAPVRVLGDAVIDPGKSFAKL